MPRSRRKPKHRTQTIASAYGGSPFRRYEPIRTPVREVSPPVRRKVYSRPKPFIVRNKPAVRKTHRVLVEPAPERRNRRSTRRLPAHGDQQKTIKKRIRELAKITAPAALPCAVAVRSLNLRKFIQMRKRLARGFGGHMLRKRYSEEERRQLIERKCV